MSRVTCAGCGRDVERRMAILDLGSDFDRDFDRDFYCNPECFRTTKWVESRVSKQEVRAWALVLGAGGRALFSHTEAEKAQAVATALDGSLRGVSYTLGSRNAMEPDFYATIEVVLEPDYPNELLRRQLEGK